MSLSESLSRRAALSLIVLGLAVFAAGAVLQARGIALPAMLGSATTFGVAAKIGGGIAILGLLAFALAQMSGGASGDRLSRLDPAPETAEADDLPPNVTPQRMAEWQRRLAEKAATAGTGIEADSPRRRIAARIHRGALVIVALAFVGLLGITLWNQIAASLAAPAVAETVAPAPRMSPGERIEAAAGLVADGLVPDAPADRHWTEIDLSGIAEWFVSRWLLALTGDRIAMMQLGGIAGGLFAALVGLRLFFAMRSALRPRYRPMTGL